MSLTIGVISKSCVVFFTRIKLVVHVLVHAPLVGTHVWSHASNGEDCIPTAISSGVDISEVLGCHLLQQMSFQWASRKLLQGFVSHELVAYLSIFKPILIQWIMAILSKECKPDRFKLHNSLKLSFTSIQGVCLNFIDCESFLESNSPGILALCGTNLDFSIDLGNFSLRGYLPLIRNYSTTHIHGLAVYVKEVLPFAWDLSLENHANSSICFQLAFLNSVSYFFLYRSPSLSLCSVFDSISSNIDEVH